MTTPNVRCTCTGTCHPPHGDSLYRRYAAAMAAGVDPRPINGVLRRDTGTVHGPDRPAIIAHRYWCPSCDAAAGEPCRLSARFTQDYSHESRHQVARRALWRALSRELDVRMGWTVG